MLIRPWDAADDETEWRSWLERHDRFGVLAVPHREPGEAPLVLPLHLSWQGDERWIGHLARANPVWPHLEHAGKVRVAFHGAEAFIPGPWRVDDGTPPEAGVPTSYYVAVQFVCRPTIVDDPALLAELLERQLADRQPQGSYAAVVPGQPPYGALLRSIRGLWLDVLSVDAKFKFDDHKPRELRERVSTALEARELPQDRAAAREQRRRGARHP